MKDIIETHKMVEALFLQQEKIWLLMTGKNGEPYILFAKRMH